MPDSIPPSLQALIAHTKGQGWTGSYRVRQEGPDRFRAYTAAGPVTTNGIAATREAALERIAWFVLRDLTDLWKNDHSMSMDGAYAMHRIYAKR